MTGLGFLPGQLQSSSAQAVSSDGSIIVGTAPGASIWDSVNGLRDLEEVLESDLGLDLQGFSLIAATGISGDGHSIVGYASDPYGQTKSWIAVIPPACDDGVDNDADGLTDLDDPGCRKPDWPLEDPECGDGVDNDGDSFVDFPDDPGCMDGAKTREDPRCNDGIDNDGNGLIDLDDPVCANAWSGNEGGGCGFGYEAGFLFLPLLWLHRRRRRALA